MTHRGEKPGLADIGRISRFPCARQIFVERCQFCRALRDPALQGFIGQAQGLGGFHPVGDVVP